jgi:dihydrofolate reductase
MKAIIAAYSSGRVIGNRGQIPWLGQLPADLKRVRELSTRQAIIMGRTTFESIGRPLPDRQNIVLSRSAATINGVAAAADLPAAFKLVEPGRTAFIFGGASVYQQAINEVDVLYITEIQADFAGDSFFPEIDPKIWQQTARQDFLPDAKNRYSYSFITYKRCK